MCGGWVQVMRISLAGFTCDGCFTWVETPIGRRSGGDVLHHLAVRLRQRSTRFSNKGLIASKTFNSISLFVGTAFSRPGQFHGLRYSRARPPQAARPWQRQSCLQQRWRPGPTTAPAPGPPARGRTPPARRPAWDLRTTPRQPPPSLTPRCCSVWTTLRGTARSGRASELRRVGRNRLSCAPLAPRPVRRASGDGPARGAPRTRCPLAPVQGRGRCAGRPLRQPRAQAGGRALRELRAHAPQRLPRAPPMW